jgi:hypothetical protein
MKGPHDSDTEKRLFLGLIVIQAFHSAEEYLFKLYDVFPPARFLSGLVASNRQVGFAVMNVLLVLFGMWCYLWPVRRKWKIAAALMWVWVVVELFNGLVHPAWSLLQRSYTPGMMTSLLLFPVALSLGRKLLVTTDDS